MSASAGKRTQEKLLVNLERENNFNDINVNQDNSDTLSNYATDIEQEAEEIEENNDDEFDLSINKKTLVTLLKLINSTKFEKSKKSSSNHELQDVLRGLREAIPIITSKSQPAVIFDFLEKCEIYFDSFQENLSWDWMKKIATSKLSADASIWWKNYEQANPVGSPGHVDCWKNFRAAIQYHFVPQGYERSILKELSFIRQGKTPLREFLIQFSKLVGQATKLLSQ
ncbi:hypothetical protein HMI54_012216 [Coelomomyces lativittatus]|nr:hypothetical protein HMI54_012216 [Coelomomyces lativittatus]